MTAITSDEYRRQAALVFPSFTRARTDRIADHALAEEAHEKGLAAGHRQPRYYSSPPSGTDPARGPFAPVERRKPRKGRRS